jgi:hypothetical protein
MRIGARLNILLPEFDVRNESKDSNFARFADFERGRGIKTLRGKERGDPQKS